MKKKLKKGIGRRVPFYPNAWEEHLYETETSK